MHTLLCSANEMLCYFKRKWFPCFHVYMHNLVSRNSISLSVTVRLFVAGENGENKRFKTNRTTHQSIGKHNLKITNRSRADCRTPIHSRKTESKTMWFDWCRWHSVRTFCFSKWLAKVQAQAIFVIGILDCSPSWECWENANNLSEFHVIFFSPKNGKWKWKNYFRCTTISTSLCFIHQISIFVPFETMQCNLPYVKMDCFRCLINGGEIWENIMLIDKYIIQRVFRWNSCFALSTPPLTLTEKVRVFAILGKSKQTLQSRRLQVIRLKQ